MTTQGFDTNAAPGYGDPQGSPQPAAPKSGVKKWLPVAGGVAVAGVAGLYSLTGGFGIGDPKVGDCIASKGESSFEVVDCSAAEAEARVVGIAAEEMTSAEFDASADPCTAFASAEVALWSGEITEKGTVFCAETV